MTGMNFAKCINQLQSEKYGISQRITEIIMQSMAQII